ncbi:hypothetical protein [Serpentinicella alkaliphila]|uniref:Uncharacterized protein n=2 Tax=Serpentinicella alkaliphila TaxID=1734049 RepID=A0A4R2TNX5_9FIRM|nr:hypothetical protein [Serpentinicella alkaliphila]TCP99108.1 hypothetical protein EDD79_103637 [Serpentinicella alkaliphila]
MDVVKLPYKTIIYIPLKDGHNKALSQIAIDILLEECLKQLISLGHGATVIDGMGYWEEQLSGAITSSKTKLIICYVADIKKAEVLILKLALWVKETTDSEAICFEINNCLYIV